MTDSPRLIGRSRVQPRALSLGSAVPQRRPFDDTRPAEPVEAVTPKTADELRADSEERRDQQPMTTGCGFCDWRFEGTAGTCRAAAAAHRAAEHPAATNRAGRGRGGGLGSWRRDGDPDGAKRAEANRVRAEREDAERLAKIERGRQRDALAAMDAGEQQPLAEDDSGDVGASPTPATADTEGNPMTDTNGRTPRGVSQRQILGALLAGHTTPAAIGQAIDKDGKQVAATLSTLVGKGFAAKVGYGVYGPTGEGKRVYASGQSLDLRQKDSGREPMAAAEGPGPHQVTASTPPALPADEESSRPEETPPLPAAIEPAPDDEDQPASDSAAADEIEEPEVALAIPSPRDPIRTAAIPYDAELLDDEADFLIRRAAALRQMASAIRVLAEPRELAA